MESVNTVSDYLRWRGDIPFQSMPVNEVDAYILAKTGSPDLDGIIPAEGEAVTFRQAYEAFFNRKDINPSYWGKLIPSQQIQNLRDASQTVRFGDVLLSDYLQKYSPSRTEQISALTLTVPNGSTVVTFRGTDDTVIGWKENFLLAVHGSVAAQRDAERYLERVAERHPGELTVMGHSKGGNLAIYAAINAPKPIRDRITKVINFDGPGFFPELWQSPAAKEMEGRIVNFASQHTMVGALLTQGGTTEICRSTRQGPLAHEAMFWEVMGPGFIRAEKREPASLEFGRLINTQVNRMTDEEITRVTEDFFQVLTSGGADTLTGIARQNPKQMAQMLKQIAGTESVRELCAGLAELLFAGDSAMGAWVFRRWRGSAKAPQQTTPTDKGEGT